MSKIRLTTPENIEVEYKLADLGSRTGAVIIDLMIQGLVLSVLLLFVLLISGYQPELWAAYSGWIIGSSLFMAMVLIYSYFIVMELKMNGKTPGKKVLKLRTIRKNGQPITLKHSAIRNLFRIFIDMSGIGLLFIFFNSHHKRVGDFAASTIVVVEEKKSRPVVLATESEPTDRVKNYVSKEEYELLCDYSRRKEDLQNPAVLKTKINDYFADKYGDSEVLAKVEKIIAKL